MKGLLRKAIGAVKVFLGMSKAHAHIIDQSYEDLSEDFVWAEPIGVKTGPPTPRRNNGFKRNRRAELKLSAKRNR
jgi:hypothetical protein